MGTRYEKQIARFEKMFIEADDESIRQSMQQEDEISYTYRLLEDYKAEIAQLKAELSSGGQRKKVLEVVRQPDSNTLRTPHSLTVTNKEHDTTHRLVEDKNKHFPRDSKRRHSA
jgi:hypothetical protein